ncbi:MAG: DUF1684 domain-containing protein [Mycetocola sp.]
MTLSAQDTTATASPFITDWQRWHEARERVAAAPHGTASLIATTWLSQTPLAIEGVPGLWQATADGVRGSGLAGHGVTTAVGEPADDSVELTPGAELHHGDRLLRTIVRDGEHALRVFDPQASTRTTLEGISTFVPEPSWVIPGRFIAAEEGAHAPVTSIDGHTAERPVAGVVEFDLDGPRRLRVSGGPAGLQAVFADATSGVETFRFRFLSVAAPDADGRVVLDFTRAIVPPCSFSDHYICPLPPAENRLPVAVLAGEKQVVRSEVPA